jgi:hypothetical protein
MALRIWSAASAKRFVSMLMPMPHSVRPHIGLHTFERILADEERPFHCAVMSPEMNGTSRAIEDSALVRELETDHSRCSSLDAGYPAFS